MIFDCEDAFILKRVGKKREVVGTVTGVIRPEDNIEGKENVLVESFLNKLLHLDVVVARPHQFVPEEDVLVPRLWVL